MPHSNLSPDDARLLHDVLRRVERLERRRLPEFPIVNVPTEANYTYGETLAAGEIVYINSDSTVEKASASASTPHIPSFGLALEPGSAGEIHKVLLFGTFASTAYSWTPGGLLWLSTTAGLLTQDQPDGTDEGIQPMGFAIDATSIFFRPDITWLTHV